MNKDVNICMKKKKKYFYADVLMGMNLIYPLYIQSYKADVKSHSPPALFLLLTSFLTSVSACVSVTSSSLVRTSLEIFFIFALCIKSYKCNGCSDCRFIKLMDMVYSCRIFTC